MVVDPRGVEALEAHLFYMKELVRGGGGVVVERDGALAYRSPLDLPFLVNSVARVDPAASADAVTRLAHEVFGMRGFELICLAGRDDDLRAAALAQGMQPGGPDPLQHVAGPVDAGTAKAYGLEVRVVTDAAGVTDAAAVNQDASDVYGVFPSDFFARIFSPPQALLANHLRVYVGYENGQPVATSQYARVGELCYIGWVAVVRRAMRRGLGRWITAHAVNDAIADGVKGAVLVASPMGAPLYRQMGFADVGELNSVYSKPASQPSP